MTDEIARVSKNPELACITRETVRQAITESLKQLPFVASAFAVLGGIYRGINAARYQDFLECIGKPLGCDNFEAATDYIVENIEEPWMLEGLERGWRAVLETLDPTARQCAYLMVADYMAKKKTPDRFHRQFGNLFMESDIQILHFVLEVVDILEAAPKGARLFSLDISKEKTSEEVFFFIHRVEHSATHSYRVDSVPDTERLLNALELLIRNGLCAPHSGLGGGHPDHERFEYVDSCAIFRDHHLALLATLRGYLEPVRAQKAS